MCPFTTQIEGEMTRWRGKCGGERGIRTLGRAFGPYDGLANRWFKPLTHLSALTYECRTQNEELRKMIPGNALNSTFCVLHSIAFGGGGGIRTHGPGHPGRRFSRPLP